MQVGEEPPPGFAIALSARKNPKALLQSDAQKTIVRCVEALAMQDWNAALNQFPCHPESTVWVDMKGSATEPRLLVKHALWALRALYDTWEFNLKHYEETNIQILNPERKLLGVGQFYLSAGPSTDTSQTLGQAAGSAQLVGRDAANPDGLVLAAVNDPKERINIKWGFYASTEKICNAGMFTRIVIGTLIILAEKPANAPFEGDVGYYAPAEISMLVAPSNRGQQETGELNVGFAIRALVLVSETMATYKQPVTDRYRAFHNKISLNGIYLMRSAMYKGKILPPGLATDDEDSPVDVVRRRRRREAEA